MKNWDLSMELNVSVSVGPHTLNEGNKRGDWMKQWLMIQNFHSTQHDVQRNNWTTWWWTGNACVAAETLKQMT